MWWETVGCDSATGAVRWQMQASPSGCAATREISRSPQMAAGFLTTLAGDRVDVRSAGSLPADQVNPVVVAAMAEVGIDITGEQPKVLSTDAVRAADVVITTGCGDACPVFPGKRYEDWDLPDPAGQPIEAVRPIRDQIRVRVETLTAELVAR
jgi:arsenate reductase